MSILNIIRRTPTEKPIFRNPIVNDPMRLMRDFFGWEPFREMSAMTPPQEWLPTFVPDFEVKETKESFVFRADLPGVQEKDLELALTGNRLVVSGKREAELEEKGETFYTCERSYGSFTRSFTLPDGIDDVHVTAALKDGVLTIVLPKKAEVLPRKIEIKAIEHKA
jgi:HSP20 family protein